MKDWHTTRKGKSGHISDLTDAHLLNIVKSFKRKAKNGLVTKVKGQGGEYYYAKTLFDQGALDELNYKAYIAEYTKRKLKIK